MTSASDTAGYGTRAAEDLAAQYESITFEDVHRDVLHLFPNEPGYVLEYRRRFRTRCCSAGASRASGRRGCALT
ncbi:MAG: hypothetical protein CBARDCOR_0336 [uncultured Caballeronia sp.]|nr:MAG: hypothetical protein CBARDCOR_0336 [uncultured Caballeronia sp.]